MKKAILIMNDELHYLQEVTKQVTLKLENYIGILYDLKNKPSKKRNRQRKWFYK